VRRGLGGLFLVGVALAQSGPSLQKEREAQQEAYQNWRQTDPNLERDASTAGATLGARADKAAAAAAKYFSARKTYLASLETEARQKASAVKAVSLAPNVTPNLEAHLNGRSTILGASIETIAHDSDRGIQQLRQALERERAAVIALSAGLKDLQKTQEAVAQTTGSTEQVRVRTSQLYQKLAASFKQSAELTEKSGTAWGNYYRSLSDAARNSAAPVTSANPTPSAGSVRALSNTPGSDSPTARSITPLPLSRYVGAWTYPTVGAHYHGPQPVSADLEVHEENGHASGTLSARFKAPVGGTGSPVMRLDFEGALEGSRDQRFAVTTSDGAKGTLELIPGPAFNLLEVNFSTDDTKAGTVHQANFLLVKK